MIVARLRETGRTRTAAWITIAGALGIVVAALAFFRPGDFGLAYEAFALALAAWTLGPLATWTPRARIARAEIVGDGQAVMIGDRRIDRGTVTGVSVAKAARGVSIAVQTAEERSFFLEVETMAQANAIASALGGPTDRGLSRGSVVVLVPTRWPLLLQRALALVGPIVAATYYVAANGAVPGGKEVWGSLALTLGVASTLIFLIQPGIRKEIGLTAKGVIIKGRTFERDAILTRQAAGGIEVVSEAGAVLLHPAWPGAAHVLLHAQQQAREDGEVADDPTAEDSPARTRSRIGINEGETVRSWLSRLDAWSRADGVYRADLPAAEELTAAVNDETLAIDERLGAQRLLRVHHRAGAPTVRIAIVDPGADVELKRRLEAILVEETAEAEERLLRLGPIFRAIHPLKR